MARHSASVAVPVGSMFDFMVLPSGRKTHSWGMAMMRVRSFVRFTVKILMPSIVKMPLEEGRGSSKRSKKRMSEDLPLDFYVRTNDY